MGRGLLAYKLCDRDFDCEHCALHAALRGDQRAPQVPDGVARSALTIAGDRLYAYGHTWIRTFDHSARVGLDALVPQLLESLDAIDLPAVGTELCATGPLCTLRTGAGNLTIRAPCAGRVVATNPRAEDDPALVLRDPYHEGWLAELRVEPAAQLRQMQHLLAPKAAEDLVRLDLQRFRRQVAMHLLTPGLGPTLNDGGEPLLTLARILGAHRYLGIVQELLS